MSKFKSGTLAARWRRNHEGMGSDIVYYFPNKPDGGLLQYALTHCPLGESRWLIDELEKRGYDLQTLEFTIRKKR